MFPLESSDIVTFMKQLGISSMPNDMFDPYVISSKKAE